MNYVGIDPSLTATGLMRIRTYKGGAQHYQAIVRTSPGTLPNDDQRRIERIMSEVFAFLPTRGEVLVGIEGAAFHPRTGSDTRVHEVNGVLKLELWRRGIPFELKPQATLRKYAENTSGVRIPPNGKGKKEAMLEAARAEGFEVDPILCPAGLAHNVSDAYWVCRLTEFDHV